MTSRGRYVSTADSPEQSVDVVRADAVLLVVVTDQRDVVEHVEGTVRLAVLVQPDQGPGDVEGDPHGLVALVGDQRVRLAGRLVDPVARGGDPVVLQVAPLAGARVGEDLLRAV